MASHLAGLGQASGTGVGLVHALGHAIGTRGRLAHGTALATVLPEVLDFYAAERGLRDRELALIGVALRAASPTEDDVSGAAAAIAALRTFLAALDQRPSLRSLGFDEASLDLLAADAMADAAIRNAPRAADHRADPSDPGCRARLSLTVARLSVSLRAKAAARSMHSASLVCPVRR